MPDCVFVFLIERRPRRRPSLRVSGARALERKNGARGQGEGREGRRSCLASFGRRRRKSADEKDSGLSVRLPRVLLAIHARFEYSYIELEVFFPPRYKEEKTAASQRTSVALARISPGLFFQARATAVDLKKTSTPLLINSSSLAAAVSLLALLASNRQCFTTSGYPRTSALHLCKQSRK